VTHRAPRPLLLALALVLALVADACGSEEKAPEPPATLVRLEDLATRAAQQATATASPTATAPPIATASATQTIAPAPGATAIPSATPIPSRTPTARSSPTAPPSVTASAAQTITTAPTASATPRPPDTVTPAPSATDTPTPTAAPDAEPFEFIFYGDARGSDDLYLLTRSGATRALTTGPADEREPSCSSDGRRVVYASNASGRFQIHSLDLVSGSSVALTSSDGMNFAPVFSPDGRRIAFVSTRGSGIPTIWVMNADGGNPRQVTTDLGRDTTPAWGPDGRELFFAHEAGGPWRLYLVVLQAGVEGETALLPPELAEGNLVWPAVDEGGERIAYTRWDNLEDPQTADIYLLDYRQPAPVALRAGPGADIVWGWADEAHLLASVGARDDVQIALVEINTGAATRLTRGGSFNGGARRCPVPRAALPPAPTPAPYPTLTPSATPAPDAHGGAFPAALWAAAGEKHIVQPGETLLKVGYRYGVNWQLLAALNALPDPNRLQIGQTLTVPVTQLGRVRSGEQQPGADQIVPLGRKEIVVDLDEQIIRAYQDGDLLRTVAVSTGLPETPTVEGEFSIYLKRPAQLMSGPGYYLPGVPWVMYFYQGYGIHGTYWHDNFGQPMSHGCVNLPTAEAAWFYDWAEIGTPVLVRR